MAELKQELSYIMLGQQGGLNRIKILELLKQRSYNLNQLANELNLNYRTIKHHVEILLNYDLIKSSGGGYGKVYFISPKLEAEYDMLEDMKKNLKAVFRSPKLFETVVEQTHEGIILLDEKKDIIFINSSAVDITGYKDEELLGKKVDCLLGPKFYHGFEQELDKSEKFLEKRMDINTKNGEKKILDVTIDNFSFDGGEHSGFSLFMKDVTEKVEQEEILGALMDLSGVVMAYMDTNFDIVYVNSAYSDKTEMSPEKLMGMNHFDLFPDDENKDIFQKVIESGRKVSITDRPLFSSEDGGTCWSVEPIRGGKNKIKGVLLSSFDPTSS